MGAHLIDGMFQSDKYPECPRGKVPLSCKDKMAQDLLYEYAQRRRSVDAEFSDDLEEALRFAGYEPSEDAKWGGSTMRKLAVVRGAISKALVELETEVTPELRRALDATAGDALSAESLASERPSFEQIYMEMARLMAQRSTCTRLKVGCVITTVDYRKVISVGFNGNASGLPNGCDSAEPGACGCVHSECNAIVNCDSPRSTEKIVFCSHLPCKMCAKLMVNVGNVRRFFYAADYRLREGLEVLTAARIPFERLS